MRFERKIYLGFTITALAFLPAIVGAFLAIQKVVTEQKALVATNAQIVLLSERLRSISLAQTSIIPVFALTGEKKLVNDYEKQYRNFEDTILTIADIDPDSADQEQIAKIMNVSRDMYKSALPGIQMKQQGRSIREVSSYFRKFTAPNSEILKNELDTLVAKESSDFQLARGHVAKVVDRVVAALVVLSLLALGLVLLIGRLTVKMMRQQKAYANSQKDLMIKERLLSQARKETVEVVAHDLKNPLGSIKMSLELVMNQLGDDLSPQELKDYLQVAYRSTESMENLIHNLLDHAKIESGHMVLEQADCDLANLARDLMRRFR